MLKSLVSLALLGVMGAAQAAIPANINFDGYCDGLTGLTKNGYGVAGTWRDTDCAGTNVAIGGTQGKAKGALAKGYIMTSDLYPVYGITLLTVINGDNTWTLYFTDGTVANSGTWSAAVAGVKQQGTKASFQK